MPLIMQQHSTDICADLRCDNCGHTSHIDGFYVQIVQCPRCLQCWDIEWLSRLRPVPYSEDAKLAIDV